ncbi:MAG: VWA domain-containing protein [Acidobacteria bacterium]|jgi:VWFA-related protein|nr:VWA domain-containing protein [Acidobacteriota bacterium]
MKKFVSTFVFILLCALVGFAQSAKPTPTPKPAPDDDIVKISTTLIQVDVTVTDKNGKIIKDLKPEDFEIYENGEKQEITNFSFISNASATTAATPNIKEKPPVPLPPAPVNPKQVKRTIALVVDDLTLSFESVHYVRQALKKFVDEQMQDGDLVAIIRTGSGIGALQQFTSDKRQLYAAIEKVRWNMAGTGNIGAFAPIEATPLEQAKANGADISDEQLDAEKDFIRGANDFREDIFATGTLGAINYIIRGMKELPGRKSILLLSDGFQLFSQSKDGFTDSTRVLDSLRRLVDLANRSSVVVYTMDARGLQTLGFTAQDNTGGLSAEAVEQRLFDRRDKLFNTQEGLVYLAKQTGGFPIINNNDLSGGIRQILDDQSYYLIGYQPDTNTFDPKTRRFNKLQIKVKRKDVNVRYRSGFFGVSEEQIKKPVNQTPYQQIMTALTSPFGVNDISLRLNTLFGNNPTQDSFVRSLLHVNAKDLKFTDEADGSKKAVFDILAVSFGDNGTVADQISQTYTLNLKTEGYQKFLTEGFVYYFTFPVKKPGAYQMRVAIRDHASQKVGSANQFIEVPNLKKDRLTLSGIILENLTFQQWNKQQNNQSKVDIDKNEKQADSMSDTALRSFKRGTILRYGFEIYKAKFSAGQIPQMQMRTKIFRDGKLIFEGKQTPVDLSGQTDLQHINASGALNLGTEMQAGDYVLQIVVTDALAKDKNKIATQFVQFEIVE